jgi:Tfp pilus assembly protein PilN
MIRINLAISSAESGGPALAAGDVGDKVLRQQGLSKLAMILLFPLALYAYEFITIPELQSSLSRVRSELSTVQAVNVSAVKARENLRKFLQDKETLQKLITSLESLKSDRLQEVKVLDLLQREIPEKTWLTNVEFKSAALKIEGLSAQRGDINNFVEALSQSIFLSNVIMTNTREVSDARGVFFSFIVTASIPDSIKAVGGP